MNEIVTDLKNLEIETLKNLKNSKSSNTLRAYSSDYRDFSAFCTKNNFSALPTDPKVLALYLTHLSQTSKFSTLKRRIEDGLLSAIERTNLKTRILIHTKSIAKYLQDTE